MPRFVILPYQLGSESALNLRDAFTVDDNRAIIPKNEPGSRYRYKNDDVLINWGNSKNNLHWALPGDVPIINAPNAVAVASNKLTFFESIQRHNENTIDHYVPIPPFTTEKHIALNWILEGGDVVARTKLNGHSGEGIVMINEIDFDNEDDDYYIENIDEWIPDAPLYTKYLKKAQEYRVHVAFGKVIDAQRKAVRPGHERPNWQVRNLDGGFIYTRGGFEATEDLKKHAVNTIKACGLDFGAVDIIFNKRMGAYTVLEVNTAPGLIGSTTSSYSFAFQNKFNPKIEEDDEIPDFDGFAEDNDEDFIKQMLNMVDNPQ